MCVISNKKEEKFNFQKIYNMNIFCITILEFRDISEKHDLNKTTKRINISEDLQKIITAPNNFSKFQILFKINYRVITQIGYYHDGLGVS